MKNHLAHITRILFGGVGALALCASLALPLACLEAGAAEAMDGHWLMNAAGEPSDYWAPPVEPIPEGLEDKFIHGPLDYKNIVNDFLTDLSNPYRDIYLQDIGFAKGREAYAACRTLIAALPAESDPYLRGQVIAKFTRLLINGGMKDAQIVEILDGVRGFMLNDPSADVRVRAALLLSHFKDHRVVEVLTRIVRDGVPVSVDNLSAVPLALSRFPSPETEALIKSMAEPPFDPEVRVQATGLSAEMGWIKMDKAEESLRAIHAKDTNVRARTLALNELVGMAKVSGAKKMAAMERYLENSIATESDDLMKRMAEIAMEQVNPKSKVLKSARASKAAYNRTAVYNYAKTWWSSANHRCGTYSSCTPWQYWGAESCGYGSHKGDCANFVSQCLDAGGEPPMGRKYCGAAEVGAAALGNWLAGHGWQRTMGHKKAPPANIAVGDVLIVHSSSSRSTSHATVVMAVNPVRIACHSSEHWNAPYNMYDGGTQPKPYREWVHNPAGSTGNLKVTITPSGVTGSARWRVDGGAWQASGTTISVAPGWHVVSFNEVANYVRAPDAGVTVVAGQTATVTRNYVRHTGSLKVTIGPAAAGTAGARWRRTGTTAWLTSGSTEAGLPTGSYVVEFNAVDGWSKPANATVSVAKDATASVTGTYVEQGGGLQVTIGPAELAAGEARWRRTGTTAWRTSGSTETGVPAGAHEVEFLAVAGWDAPANASVTVAVGGTATLGRSYVRQYGALKVTISPAAAAAAGARWRRTGTTTWRTSGSTETNIPAGACAVEFNALASPWVQPANLAAAVAKNATNALNARYNRPPALADPGSHLAHVGAALDFQVTASDPDGDGLFLSVSNAPAGGTLSSDGGTGTFHFTASPAQAGQTFAPVFTATESQGGLTDSKSASIRVGSPPTVAAPSNRTTVVGMALSFTVGASDPENDSKTFGMSGAPAGATLTGTGDSRTFSYTASPGDMGKTFAIVFTATDADGTGSRTMSLRVKSPPVFVPVNARRVRAGGLLVLAVEASDPDGDAMSFQVAGQPVSAHFTAHPTGGVFAYRPATAEIGRTYEVQFRGTDMDGTQVMTVAITVVGPDDPVTHYDSFARGALVGFGGLSAGATRRNFAAGAQSQPVGWNASGSRRNSAGVLVPEDPGVEQGGGLKVTISPAEVATAGARWRRTGTTTWQTNGFTETGLPAGSHTVEFLAVAGWDAPANASVTVPAGGTAELDRSYVRQTGALMVTISPAAAAAAGARWRRTGTTTWQTSGTTETNIPVDSYTVEFNSVDGWSKPVNAAVSVAKDATASVTGTYVEQGGGLKVTIGPAEVAAAGARWRRTGTTTWQTNGFTETGLPAGSHTVEFLAVAGWDAPANASVTVPAGGTAELDRSYVRQSGALMVTISPAAAAAAGARWRRMGTTTWLTSGTTETNIPVDSYTVEFNSVDGWSKPVNAAVSVAKDATASVTGTYVEQGGGLKVTIGPAEVATAGARWRRTGTTTWLTSGFTETGLPAGSHTVEFLAVAGWDAPANASVTVPAGGTAELDRSYMRQSGALMVTISPAAAAAAGARWRRTGTTTWQTSGTTETNIPVDSYTVEFNVLNSPWVSPDNINVSIAKNATNALSARYNRPPALADPGSHLAHVGAVLEFSVTATDPDGDAVTLSAGNVPAGGSFSSSGGTGTFHFTASPAQVGQTFAPVFTATESHGGLTDSKSASILVGSPPITWGALVGFGGPSAGATRRNFAAGAQSQPVGWNASGTWRHSGGVLVPEPGGAARALFEAQRTVQGVPYGWLLAYGLTNQPWDEAAALDQGAGMAAWEAWVAGTDPTNPATAFRVEAVNPANGRVRVAVRTVPGRRYTFSGASSLTAPDWRPLDYGLTPDGALANGPLEAAAERTEIYVPAGTGVLFLRPEVRAP